MGVSVRVSFSLHCLEALLVEDVGELEAIFEGREAGLLLEAGSIRFLEVYAVVVHSAFYTFEDLPSFAHLNRA